MSTYNRIFKQVLINEEDEFLPINTQHEREDRIPDDQMSDEEAWEQSNPDIVDDEDLLMSFNVDGLDSENIEKYSNVIRKWNEGIEAAIKQLSQILKFAASERLNEAPGSEQFIYLIKDAPKLKRDLSAFQSQVEDLSETVKIAIHTSQKEKREKSRFS